MFEYENGSVILDCSHKKDKYIQIIGDREGIKTEAKHGSFNKKAMSQKEKDGRNTHRKLVNLLCP